MPDDGWDILDEMHGTKGTKTRPHWLPDNITPVLEELPKWEYLAETLMEIEELIMHHPIPTGEVSNLRLNSD